MPKCMRFGWYLPYTPFPRETGAWKTHYVDCALSINATPLSKVRVLIKFKLRTFFVLVKKKTNNFIWNRKTRLSIDKCSICANWPTPKKKSSTIPEPKTSSILSKTVNTNSNSNTAYTFWKSITFDWFYGFFNRWTVKRPQAVDSVE